VLGRVKGALAPLAGYAALDPSCALRRSEIAGDGQTDASGGGSVLRIHTFELLSTVIHHATRSHREMPSNVNRRLWPCTRQSIYWPQFLRIEVAVYTSTTSR
jgi:hypothetical protein